MPSNSTQTFRSPKALERFSPLNEAPRQRLEEIAEQAQWLRAGKNEVLMELGDNDEHSIFLLKGNILLEAADGRKQTIKHTDPAARSPLSRLRPSRYRVTTLTPVQYVKIDNAVLDRLLEEEESSELISSHYVVEEGIDGGGDNDFATQVLAQIYEDLQQDRLLLLSWQPVALPVTTLLLGGGEESEALSRIALLDPVLTVKLLRSAAENRQAEIPERLSGAIHSLGLERIRRIAFLNLFRESSKPHSALMNQIFRSAWRQAITVSRLAGELAAEQGLTPVESVAVAGLLHNIGKLTLVSYAYNFYREVNLEELKMSTQLFAKETGRMVLTHWNLPPYLVRGITDSFEWSQEHGGSEVTLSDILIAARLYARLAHGKSSLKEVPALRKLKLEDPNSNRGQALRRKAIQSVTEAQKFLGLDRRSNKPKPREPETTA